ncbi:MAG: branched-chain-amino-acid transaminase [Candidatus Omnitrophota bacterium]|nr:branched-chain-amino-acid transaminase [Candidatus Omnitrophota bacterium]
MGLQIYIDGKFYEKEQAKISVLDHGLLYGDGVFEGIRSYNKRVFKMKEHIDRLYESARAVMLDIPFSKREITASAISVLRKNNLNDAYIRLIVTRGMGDLGLDPRKCGKPSIIIIADKIALYPRGFYKNGLEIITVPTRRNAPEALRPQVKSLNYLNNVLAKIEALNSGFEEAIMLNSEGYVTECTGDNIFAVKRGKLFTPPVHLGVLNGITKNCVIDIACAQNLKFSEKVFTRHELFSADECFLTGTAAEIIPVVKIDGRIIGKGPPGKITVKLMDKFRALTKKEGIKY